MVKFSLHNISSSILNLGSQYIFGTVNSFIHLKSTSRLVQTPLQSSNRGSFFFHYPIYSLLDPKLEEKKPLIYATEFVKNAEKERGRHHIGESFGKLHTLLERNLLVNRRTKGSILQQLIIKKD